MKGISMIFVVLLVFVLLIFSSFQLQNSQTDNVFTGQAKGENGLVKVAVTIKNNQIEKITILENHESDFTAIVFDSIPNMIIKSNSPNVDGVSGATVSCNAIMEAVKDAVRKSGVSLQAKKKIVRTVAAENTSTDVVIIGSGGAGLAAAIEVSKAGAKVIVVEKNSFIGGNTNYANGMNAAGTSKGRNYTPELFYEETMKGGHYLNNPDLVKVLAYQSEEAAHWIDSLKKVASTLQENHLSSMDETAFGAQLIRILNAEIKKRKLDVRLNTKAVKILSADNVVTGIQVETGTGHSYTIHSKAVVLVQIRLWCKSGYGYPLQSEIKRICNDQSTRSHRRCFWNGRKTGCSSGGYESNSNPSHCIAHQASNHYRRGSRCGCYIDKPVREAIC
jgi:fumarate reductase flavoprotein subunit